MGRDAEEPTQQTKPAKGKPIEIPVPKRKDIEDLIDRAAKPTDETPAARGGR